MSSWRRALALSALESPELAVRMACSAAWLRTWSCCWAAREAASAPRSASASAAKLLETWRWEVASSVLARASPSL